MSSNEQNQEVPKEENKILNYLIEVRGSLSKVKQNRDKYLNSKDVQHTYQDVLTKVRELDDIRKINHKEATGVTLIHNSELHNRVDSILDDVFQLLSLCFLTVGLKKSAPATYASLSTVQSLLEHLKESRIYTHHDLRPIKERLDEISKIVDESCADEKRDSDKEEDESLSEEFRKIDTERNKNKIEQDLLLKAKLCHCLNLYNEIESKLESIDPSLASLMEKLFQIRRNLLSLVTLSNKNLSFPVNDDKLSSVGLEVENNSESTNTRISREIVQKKLESLQIELTDLENNRDENGNFRSLETNMASDQGQNVLNGLVDDCHDLINDLSHHPNNSTDNAITLFNDENLQKIYDELIDIKTTLENLMITRRWTLRETDLFSYQKRLSAVDAKRINGKFPTSDGNVTANSKGQSILLYLLRRCYTIIYKLLESSEPVSESLQPIHNQLSTVRRCLLELKRMGGVNNERELYPYIMKLTSLDNLRKDGKFYDSDGNIPEGQGILNALLASCFDIMHELKVEAEEREENGEGGDDSDSEDNYEEGNDYY
ncbi:similar to Saccharomyces cerevisiae YPL260W Putative substrate of cAMP-dependent protein kinase (PKA) [Maudiozyma barnettii]|uniref:Similar to Saccharomyces cerevisiae YPL260W Putative substrate of cAMP-dependent protein kinase (PKA) n=1 Tax=Maudiozyma barnettii TaxID=61262 RepID=A0A8H2VEI5_9SACH|nr:Cub1p [Kazachstania barnettii]CAB4254071.1 similar to Saccharomyces cerevisiae YPL260W Putative substrate of cAMP-dependent protein kinase (PKA) [Kazachstania barnettii]CAD1781821.1 similar to Saccharomyces cerevisiae YPL260W Putative substrate of cAMP-dependent protein kinase (PKA) [Kazachstania barnettii]